MFHIFGILLHDMNNMYMYSVICSLIINMCTLKKTDLGFLSKVKLLCLAGELI